MLLVATRPAQYPVAVLYRALLFLCVRKNDISKAVLKRGFSSRFDGCSLRSFYTLWAVKIKDVCISNLGSIQGSRTSLLLDRG